MNAESETGKTEKKAPAKVTGRRYSSVADLISGEKMPAEVKKAYDELEGQTRLTEHLAILRQTAQITQEEMAKILGCTQSAVSKLESGLDEDITVGQIREYSKATKERIGILFGKPMNHVEAVKACALGIKHHLSALAGIAHQDEQLESAIQGFFGESFFNLLTILSKCQREMPNGDEFEVRLQSNASKLKRPKQKKSPENEFCAELAAV